MRKPLFALRSRAFSVATVAVLAGIAASCSSSLGQKEVFTGSTANQRNIIGSANDQPIAPAYGSDTVTRTDLPPPQGATAWNAPAPSYGAPSYGTPAVPLDDTQYAWSAVGGTVVTVGRGETLDNLAVKYSVPQAQILSANQMVSASQIIPGRTIVIPRRVAVVPGAAQPAQPTIADNRTYTYTPAQPQYAPAQTIYTPQPAPIPAGAATYVVQDGDTLYGISRRTGTSVDQLMALNGLSSTAIQIGETLRLSGTTIATAAPAPRQVASAAPAPTVRLAPPAPRATNRTIASVPQPAPSVPVDIAPTPASLSPADDLADPPSVNGTTFRWPVRGRIISGFGSQPNGQRNDGINMAVPEGTSVKAAEAGTVIYAGNELEGYGNLILVRHADGWVSAYAHNKDLLVKRGDTVRRGQIIAHAGMTGSVSAPQVHFELRQGSKPVNPLDYLSS